MTDIIQIPQGGGVPQIPQTGIDDPKLRPVIDAIRTTLNTRAHSKDQLDRWVTWRDLVSNDIVRLIIGSRVYTGAGGSTFIPVGGTDGELDFTPPPAPTGLTATGALTTIILEWDDPLYTNFNFAEIWRSGEDNLGTAVKIGTTNATLYSDPVAPGSVYYYWVRFVSRADVTGPYQGTSGVRGETSQDPAYLLEILTGQITESQLYEDLGTRLDGIENNQVSISSLEGKYTVKIDNNGYVTGYGLASESNNGTPVSTFAVRADSFYIASPAGPGITPAVPFIVRTTPTTINGVSVPAGVYVSDAFIQNGTITNAKIGNAAIDDAKISDLSATKITAGSITTGSYIQSTNYSQGSSGWIIHGNGTAEFAAAAIRGQLTAAQIDSRGLTIKDNAGNVLFGAGTPVSVSNISGLGTLATQNSVSAGDVSGLGSLATQSSVNWNTQITNIPSFGNFAYLNSITSANISTYIQGAAIGTAYIANGAITNALIANAAVGTANIQDAAITNAKIGTAAIGNANIADAAINSAKIENGSITNAKIVDAAITNAKIGNLQVDTLKLANNAVTVSTGSAASSSVQIFLGDNAEVVNAYLVVSGGSVLVQGLVEVEIPDFSSEFDGTLVWVRLFREAQLVYTARTRATTAIPISYLDNSGGGTFAINVYVTNGSYAYINYRSIYLFGAKK
jgi:hypothetical protein